MLVCAVVMCGLETCSKLNKRKVTERHDTLRSYFKSSVLFPQLIR